MKIGTLLKYQHHEGLGIFVYLGAVFDNSTWCKLYSIKTGSETTDLFRSMVVIHEII